MLPLYIAVVIISITVVFIFLFIRRFTIVRINGVSMLPTLKPGQFRIVDRINFSRSLDDVAKNPDKYTDRIYIVQSPTGRIVIKRMIYISVNTMGLDFWVEGDNKDHSEDSRNYGFVRRGDILGELVDYKTFWKRLIQP
jgi:signal peptidase I